MAKDIRFNEDARTAIRRGIDKLADAVTMTLGPRGRAAVIDTMFGAPQVTFDGVTVAKQVVLKDAYENLGAKLIKQAAEKTNDNVGDGTTTSVVLAHTLISEGEKVLGEKGFNVIRLVEDLSVIGETVIKELDAQAEKIAGPKEIEEVAILSSKDERTGKLIAEIMQKVGTEGVVAVEDSQTLENSYEMVEGMQIDRGYISPYMVTDMAKSEAVIDKPYILVTDHKMTSINELVPLIEGLIKNGDKNIVIIAEDMEGEALATLVVNKMRGILNAVAVRAPGWGSGKEDMLQDIATVTGAELISDKAGMKLKDITLDQLGTARRVIVTSDTTVIVDGGGDKVKISERVAQVKNLIDEAKSEYDKNNLQERLGKLTGGVALIKVGGATESAQKELKQRVEDAVAATRAAMEDGIVPGGGRALLNVDISGVKNVSSESISIMGDALRAPIFAIIKNSGKDIQLVSPKLGKDPWTGFNAITGKIGNLKESGIIDPLKVTKTAFINALSVARTYLVMGVAMTDIPEDKKDGK